MTQYVHIDVAVLGGLGCNKVLARLHSYALRKQFLCSQAFSLSKLDRQKVVEILISEQVPQRCSDTSCLFISTGIKLPSILCGFGLK